MLKKFECHINFEYNRNIGPVKYLYEYIYKGHDRASIKIIENKQCRVYNEAEKDVGGRWIAPTEACW